MKLYQLVLLILGFNLMTFGSGVLIIPLLQKSLVDQMHVLTIDQLLYAFTIARVTPGQANVYVASIGYMMFGLSGAFFTSVAVLAPGYLMLPLIHGYERIRTLPVVQGFTRGLVAASVGLIFAATLQIGRVTLVHPLAWLSFILTILMVQILKWNSALGLLLASLLTAIVKLLL